MKQKVLSFAREPETQRLFDSVPPEQDAMDQLFDDFALGKSARRENASGKLAEEEVMAEGGLEAVADSLQRLANRMDDIEEAVGSGRKRSRRRGRDEDDEPESAREMEGRSRRGEPRQVAFEIRVPVGRNGGTLKGLLIFDDVRIRDDRDLEDLANEVERKFRLANVFTKQEFRGGNGGYGGGYDRGRDWGRDRGYGDRDWRRY